MKRKKKTRERLNEWQDALTVALGQFTNAALKEHDISSSTSGGNAGSAGPVCQTVTTGEAAGAFGGSQGLSAVPPLPAGSAREYHSIVLGGGTAGMVAAVELASKGCSVLLVEPKAVLGGRIRVWELNGVPEGEDGSPALPPIKVCDSMIFTLRCAIDSNMNK
eukprot:GHVU01219310.1.p1 GENE.GHVU01219310.1~~GHVU01219310.1.p1  ORF type:complete len:163 (+),score=19.84 GHVU01219310.1:1032-1520(+)